MRLVASVFPVCALNFLCMNVHKTANIILCCRYFCHTSYCSGLYCKHCHIKVYCVIRLHQVQYLVLFLARYYQQILQQILY